MQAREPGSLESPSGAAGNGKTAQSYIAGIGASGALLAGAVVTFVFLVGTVSFEVWPAASTDGGAESLGVAELSGGGDGTASASLGTTVALIADSVPTPDAPAAKAPKASGELDGGAGTDDGSGGSGGGSPDRPGGDGGTVGGDPPGGGNGGDNDPSDRPSHSKPRPDDGSTVPGTAGGGSSGGGGEGDRPSAGEGGRG